MAKWLVTQKDNQFSVDGLQDLVAMAKEGRLVAGDMVQPPGASEWLYAAEVPELKAVASDNVAGLSDSSRTMLAIGSTLAMALLALIGAALAVVAYLQLPDGTEHIMGEGGLQYSEMLITESGVPLRAEPDAASPPATTLDKDDVVDLLAKRGAFYKARTKSGQEGWVPVSQVIPLYQLGDESVRAEYDPLYNPDKYVNIANAGWMLAENSDKTTVFKFMLTNSAKYPMTGLRIAATVKDGKGAEIEKVEFAVEGTIPAASEEGATGSTFVGTLLAEDKKSPGRLLTESSMQEMAKSDPNVQLRWVDGVEVEMKNRDFTMATIDLVEIVAVPPAGAPQE